MNHHHHPNREEDILHDVLLELDRERAKRAEAEASLRTVLEENRKLKGAQRGMGATQPTMYDLICLKTQVEGYQQLVDVLTLSNPAIRAAKESETHQQPTLPLHVVRLLEIIPYDISVREHIFRTECVIEWQTFHAKKWQANLALFPKEIKSLPLMDDMKHTRGSGNILTILASKDSLPYGVITDFEQKHRLNAQEGYPLPTDGTQWQWIASWKIDRDPNQCDGEGWSYIDAVKGSSTQPSVWTPRQDLNSRFRKRVWARQRVLVNYQHASERTRQYLKLLAENAQYASAANKISDQLIETKLALTESEDHAEKTQVDLMKEVEDLRNKLSRQHALLKAAGVDDELINCLPNEDDHGFRRLQEYLVGNEVAFKEFSTRLSHFASSAKKTGQDLAKKAEESSKDLTGVLVDRMKKQRQSNVLRSPSTNIIDKGSGTDVDTRPPSV